MYFILILTLISNYLFACFTPPSDWSWGEQQLVYCTSKIIIATYDGESFVVKESLKGDAKVGSKLKSTIPNTKDDSHNIVGVKPDCWPQTGFKKNETYVVFLNAVGKKAYTNVKDKNSKLWIEQIKKLSKNKTYESSCSVRGYPLYF